MRGCKWNVFLACGMFKISFCLPSSLSLRLRADASGLRLLLVERKFVQSDLGELLACTDLKIIDFHWISLHFCVFQLDTCVKDECQYRCGLDGVQKRKC